MSTPAIQPGIVGNAARLVGLLLALALLTVLVVDQRPWDRLFAAEPRVGIVFDGQRFQLDAGDAGIVAQRAAEHAHRGAASANDAMTRLVTAELDALFASLSERLPDYADWYFSLKGEYARLSLLLLRWGGLATADPMVDKAAELVFGGEESAARLAAIEQSVQGMLAGHASELQNTWVEELLNLAREPEPARAGSTTATVLLLDDLVGEFSGHGSSEFLARLSASSAGAASAGVAAPLVARLALRSPAVAAGRGTLTLKGAGRAAARAGTAGAGMLGCAAAGPAAWVCALGVGGAAWLATDWALITADEWRNRDELIAEWEERLVLLRTELEEDLLAHYGQAIEGWRESMRLEVERSFSPLDSLRGRSGPPAI
jgi:hypothetical protein